MEGNTSLNNIIEQICIGKRDFSLKEINDYLISSIYVINSNSMEADMFKYFQLYHKQMIGQIAKEYDLDLGEKLNIKKTYVAKKIAGQLCLYNEGMKSILFIQNYMVCNNMVILKKCNSENEKVIPLLNTNRY